MSSSEFSEWLAYHNLEPFGAEREDLRIGMGTAPILNCLSGKKGKKAKPKDWIMISKRLEPEQDWQDMQAVFKGLAEYYKEEKPKKGENTR